jgi:hypothetical protein
MSEDDDKSRKPTEPMRVVQLSEAQAGAIHDIRVARRARVLAVEKVREVEMALYSPQERRIQASFEAMREFLLRDSKIEVFENRKALSEKWAVDCDLLFDKRFIHFVSVRGLSKGRYDFSSGRWIMEGDECVTRSFGIAADGTLAEIGHAESGVALEFNQLEISGFLAFSQYLEFLRSDPTGKDSKQRDSKTNLAAVFEEIYVPFYRQPEEFCRRFLDTQGRPLDSMPVSSWIPIGQVRELIMHHLIKKNSWLYPLENLAHERGDVQTDWLEIPDLSKESPAKAEEIRAAIAECTKQTIFTLLEFADDVKFAECEAVRNRLAEDAFWKPDDATEYVVVDVSGSAKAYSFPFLPPTTPFTGAWDISSKFAASKPVCVKSFCASASIPDMMPYGLV